MVEIYSNFYLYQMVEKGVEPNKSTLAIARSVSISKRCSARLGQPENAVGPGRKPGKNGIFLADTFEILGGAIQFPGAKNKTSIQEQLPTDEKARFR